MPNGNDLFIKLYLDEDVSVVVAAILNGRGYDALTARDARMLQAPDVGQLRYAAANHRVLLTHNIVDFVEIALQFTRSVERHYGIILAVRRASDAELAARIVAILNTVTLDEMIDRVRYI